MLISLIKDFCPHWSLSKITEVVYLGTQVSPEYEKKLREAAKEIGVNINICLGGVDNAKFQKAWKKRLQQQQQQQRNDIEVDDDNDDDDDDDDDDCKST